MEFDQERETERRDKEEAQEELRLSEERFQLMVSAVKDYAIFMLDPRGRIASWNEGARRIKGYAPEEILGKHFSIFYTRPDIDRGHPQYELEKASAEGEYQEEGWRLRKDGSRFWASVLITRVNDADGNLIGFAKVTRDLTERKLAEEQLRKANAGLEKRVQERTRELEEALRSRDEFLSIASHELKTPLTSLQLQLQLVSRRLSQDASDSALIEDLSKSVAISLRQVGSLTRLVSDLLDVSQFRHSRFELHRSEFNLSEMVEEVAERYRGEGRVSGTRILTELEPEAEGCWDRMRLEQVLANLLTNALKYAPGSTVTIRTEVRENLVRLEVQDQGPGISEGILPTIFDRFERGEPSRNVAGLGLGLYIVKRIIEFHHGKITVTSLPETGTTFAIELPRK